MKLLRSFFLSTALLGLWSMSSLVWAGFLQFPLRCSDKDCSSTSINYAMHGAYTANAITTVLDHSMALNSNNYYPYGTTQSSSTGGDGIIKAFNGEAVSGTRLATDLRCVGGTINLQPDWSPSLRMTNDAGCGVGYSSYDEHPGYDYKAALGTPVYASASGTVISTICYLGNTGNGSCAEWGALAINHNNGYFSQYMHMNTTIFVVPGQFITAGQPIGTVGGKCVNAGGGVCNLAPHLHFEVRHIGPTIRAEIYPIVDPYGWVGSGADPLYSAPYVYPMNLWQ